MKIGQHLLCLLFDEEHSAVILRHVAWLQNGSQELRWSSSRTPTFPFIMLHCYLDRKVALSPFKYFSLVFTFLSILNILISSQVHDV